MRRRRSGQPESLELLLDTLCNTFGGVLFIGMLVVVLLQLTGGRDTPALADPTAPSLAELRDTLASLREETRLLEETAREQSAVVDPETLRALQERRARLDSLSTRHEVLRRDRDDRLLDQSARLVEVQKIDQQLDDLAVALQEARDREREALEALERERRAHTRQIDTPVAHATGKQPLAIEVRYRRLYVMHRYADDRTRLGLNLDDYVVVGEEAGGLIVSPKPSSGVPIDKVEDFKHALAGKFATFPASQYYLDMIVRVDSFEVYATLRAALNELGYEASVLLAGPTDAIRDRGGGGREVQ